ncbi:hypothetical protein [Gemmatimonas sp.]
MSSNEEFARAFMAELRLLGDDVETHVRAIWQESMQTAAEAVVIGNSFGPGVPVDTGFLRASFRLGLNTPQDGPTAPPAGLPQGGGLPAQLDLATISRAELGETVYLTTDAEYAVPLEEGTYSRGDKSGTFSRRTSEQQLKNLKGTMGPTPFVAPVVARWQSIVDDAARRTKGVP